MKVAILASGPLGDAVPARRATADADLVIAADGGARHAGRLGRRPDIVVGDLDSLPEADATRLAATGVEIQRHPEAKDETDLELALRLARARGATEVVIVGALGARWDQTLAALQLAGDPAFARIDVRLVEGFQEVRFLHPGRMLLLPDAAGTLVSLLPLGGDATGIRTRGLLFPLEDETLAFGSPRGVSNRIVSSPASVQLGGGLLAVFVLRGAEDAANA